MTSCLKRVSLKRLHRQAQRKKHPLQKIRALQLPRHNSPNPNLCCRTLFKPHPNQISMITNLRRCSKQRRPHRSWYHSLIGVSIVSMMALPSALKARPCLPTDPDGENPGNLCLIYPTHGMSLNSNSFRQGFASDGYYGTATGPRFPGAPIEAGHVPRTPIDPQRGNPGYWTRIEASAGQSRVQTSSGKAWSLKLK